MKKKLYLYIKYIIEKTIKQIRLYKHNVFYKKSS